MPLQHKGDDDDDDVKEYTTMEVSAGAPIHLHVVDEDNRTIQVLNVDNQGYVTNFSWGDSDVISKNFCCHLSNRKKSFCVTQELLK